MNFGRKHGRGAESTGALGFGRRQGHLVRCFVAIPLPEPVQVATAALTVDLAGRPGGDAVRWVRSDGYHVTLRFLGNVPAERLDALGECIALAASEMDPFEIQVGAPQPFPPGRRPKVIALSLTPEQPLAELAARLDAAVLPLGFEPEARRFQPHITLGRIRNRRFPKLDGTASPSAAPWPVHEIVLFRSDLERDGAHYAPLSRCELGSGTPPRGPESRSLTLISESM